MRLCMTKRFFGCSIILTNIFYFLELQLKPDHKPIQHLNDWKRRIVGQLTDADASREDPQLFWRRDAILTVEEEKKVSRY